MAEIRILQVVTRLAVRGVPKHVLDLAANLNPERYEVEVLAGRSEPGEGELWAEARERGIKTWYVPALQRKVDPIADLKAYADIRRRLREGSYHIVHTHISKAGILGRLAARRAGVPVVVHTYHGQVEEVSGRSLKSYLFRACERCAARWTDRIVAVSEETVKECLRRGIGKPAQYRVIHNGIDLAPFLERCSAPAARVSAGAGPCLGTIGSLTREKGLEVLLQAFTLLRQRHPQLQLQIVGDGKLRGELQAMARQLGIAESVHFQGIAADVRPWLASFDLFVLPSLQEGLPTVLLEAMAAGRPVVASRVGGIPEVVIDGRTGLLVPAGDPQALAAALDRLLRDPEMRQAMGQAGRERAVQAFGLERMLRQLEKEYEELLSARRQG